MRRVLQSTWVVALCAFLSVGHADTPLHALRYDLTPLVSHRVPGDSWARAINNRGEVVGHGRVEGIGGWHATAWRHATPASLERLEHAIYSWAAAINDRGQMAGYQEEPFMQPVRWTGHRVELLENPGVPGLGGFAYGINNRGTVVGSTGMIDPTLPGRAIRGRAVEWRGTRVRLLDEPPGAVGSFASAINDRQQIAGGTQRSDGTYATLWTQGRPILLDQSGSSSARALNSRGQVVGVTGTPGAHIATLWHQGRVVYLPALHGSSEASAINNRGQIVGTSGGRAVLWDGSMSVVDLNTRIDPQVTAAGWVLVRAKGINDWGAIVGEMYNPTATDGRWRGFLLTPRHP